MKIFYYDLETTGVDHKEHGIHQISGMIEVDGKVMEEFNYHVRPHPGCKVSKKALDIGGVTVEDIANYPQMLEMHAALTKMTAKYVNKFDNTDKFYLCGYNNASFDNRFLVEWFKRCNDRWFFSWFRPESLDVMVLAADHLKEVRHTMENFKLGTVAKFMGVEVEDEKLHDGLYDVKLTREIYRIIQKEKGSRIAPSKASNSLKEKEGNHGILL